MQTEWELGVGAALPVQIPRIQNLGVLGDKTWGWISLTNTFNDRKTAEESWNSISSPVHRARRQAWPSGLSPFQSLRALIAWVTLNINLQPNPFSLQISWHQVHHIQLASTSLTVTLGKSINTIETVILKYIQILQLQD